MNQVAGNNDATCLCKTHVQLPVAGNINSANHYPPATAKQAVKMHKRERLSSFIRMCRRAPVRPGTARKWQTYTQFGLHSLVKKKAGRQDRKHTSWEPVHGPHLSSFTNTRAPPGSAHSCCVQIQPFGRVMSVVMVCPPHGFGAKTTFTVG